MQIIKLPGVHIASK